MAIYKRNGIRNNGKISGGEISGESAVVMLMEMSKSDKINNEISSASK